ncbi:hypothetical protein NIES4075_34780 [Tolypothrix sp. NIES-4075]|uniref:hypothetical protein n=1 Tax=Tolypothrix sp. NIES-4075 TaxID=2005459 RepID=UPI000B5CD150|nr:hypothetical protein [Tolypothrix sp. NIES-4075]GAX42477.1 hypothetical protein NIES4075_34780 [Tolypothrix sp. NIES-4075]
MSYKIRRLKSHVQVYRSIEAEKSWKIEDNVEILKSEIERLNLELRYKSYELEKMKQSRYMEQEVYTLITSSLQNIDDANELAKNLLACDRLINKVLAELFDAISIYNSQINYNPGFSNKPGL